MTDTLRGRIIDAVSDALKSIPGVSAGWEGGSAAFDAVDEHSDIDLTFLVADDASVESLYAVAARALETVSPITHVHDLPPGRYYKLRDGGDCLFVDLCFLRVGDSDHCLDMERHGRVRPLFDKGEWLRARPIDDIALAAKRDTRLRELLEWFVVSQSFVRKEVRRRRQIEAMLAYWAYTLRPLVELLRMKHCPLRWDFGMRYLDRDLPPALAARVRTLVFVSDLADLETKISTAADWGIELLEELGNNRQ